MKRSKVWETAACESLLEFAEWCRGLSNALSVSTAAQRTAPHLQLAIPGPLERFPDHPIAAVLSHALLQGNVVVYVTKRGWVDISLLDVQTERLDDENLQLRWVFEDRDVALTRLVIDGGVIAGSREPPTRIQGADGSFTELLAEYPVYVYYANGSSTEASTLLVPSAQLPLMAGEMFETWDFSDTDIRAEAKRPRKQWQYNVQARTIAWVEASLDSPVVIVDDAAYEIADVIAIEPSMGSTRVHMFHCKYSSSDAPGARLKDLYEVVGQAVRSARWTDVRSCWSELARRIRTRKATRVDGRDRADVGGQLEDWAETPPGLDLHVWAVQPGASLAKINQSLEAQTLLLSALEWCNTQGATFKVAGSA